MERVERGAFADITWDEGSTMVADVVSAESADHLTKDTTDRMGGIECELGGHLGGLGGM